MLSIKKMEPLFQYDEDTSPYFEPCVIHRCYSRLMSWYVITFSFLQQKLDYQLYGTEKGYVMVDGEGFQGFSRGVALRQAAGSASRSG